jgi:predicted PurR-regulated permease PerM
MTHSRFYARSFALVTVGVLGVLLFRVLAPFFAPLLWASLLAFMLEPLHLRLERRTKGPVAAALVTLLSSLVVVGPVGLFLVAFLRQASELLTRFQAEAADRKLPALQVVLQFKPVSLVLEKLGQISSLTPEQVVAQASSAAQAGLQELASLGGTVFLGAVNIVSQFGLTMFLLFFFVRDGRELFRRALVLVPLPAAAKVRLQGTMAGVTRAVVLGTLVTALVQGSLIGIGFGIAGLPSPLVFAAVGAFSSLIPVVGTTLVWVPAVITLAAQGDSGWAVFLAVWSVVLVAGSDNVIRPLIVSGNSEASTLIVFVGVLGGVSAFGFAGIFVGPVLLTMVMALLRLALETMEAPPAVESPVPASAPPVG